MQDQLFRKSSIDRISSPEQLHDYMRVTSPKLWMILSAIIALLVGFIIYASTATMESTMPVKAEVVNVTRDDDEICTVSVTLPADQREMLQPGMTVRIAGREGKISFTLVDGEEAVAMVDMAESSQRLPDGAYDAEIVTETTTPISFLLN